jgi:hypothetical protein
MLEPLEQFLELFKGQKQSSPLRSARSFGDRDETERAPRESHDQRENAVAVSRAALQDGAVGQE